VMFGLKWFDITIMTPMRNIGWIWLILILSMGYMAYLTYRIWKEW
jgi:hypothetical protein